MRQSFFQFNKGIPFIMILNIPFVLVLSWIDFDIELLYRLNQQTFEKGSTYIILQYSTLFYLIMLRFRKTKQWLNFGTFTRETSQSKDTF